MKSGSQLATAHIHLLIGELHKEQVNIGGIFSLAAKRKIKRNVLILNASKGDYLTWL